MFSSEPLRRLSSRAEQNLSRDLCVVSPRIFLWSVFRYIHYFTQMKNTMLWTRCFSYIWFVSISRVLFPIARVINIYLGCKLLYTSSDSNSGRSQRVRSCTRVSILPFHPRPKSGFVTVRNSVLADDGRYPLRLIRHMLDCVPGLSSLRYKTRAHLSNTNQNHYIKNVYA